MNERPPVELIRLKEVCKRVGVCRITIYRLRKSSDFPDPVRLSPSVLAWHAGEVDAWIASRPRERIAA